MLSYSGYWCCPIEVTGVVLGRLTGVVLGRLTGVVLGTLLVLS